MNGIPMRLDNFTIAETALVTWRSVRRLNLVSSACTSSCAFCACELSPTHAANVPVLHQKLHDVDIILQHTARRFIPCTHPSLQLRHYQSWSEEASPWPGALQEQVDDQHYNKAAEVCYAA